MVDARVEIQEIRARRRHKSVTETVTKLSYRFKSCPDYKREKDARRVFKYPSKLDGAGTTTLRGARWE